MKETEDLKENPIAEKISGIFKDDFFTVDNTENKEIPRRGMTLVVLYGTNITAETTKFIL